MRKIVKDITLTIDGSPQGFRLTKPDAFSRVEILRLLLRLQNERPEVSPSVLDLITSLSGEELNPGETIKLFRLSQRKFYELINGKWKLPFLVLYNKRKLIIRTEFERYLKTNPEKEEEVLSDDY